ncbi:MAG TPA: xanthine dehydrogenase family protein molybdopterin-binding subunit [Steroidobacteraceae bacterium]|nr:xanthine dehydrogenase family protein molybdopterin-binding subunit [Steroidobacteraceae bacterium]
MSLIGAPIDRIDGPAKVKGRATYTGDFNLPGQAHAVMVLSTVPKGHIERIDTAVAARMPGVRLVMTHTNAPRLPEEGRAGVNPPAGRVLSLLQNDEVHYNREPIALVVAETLEQAVAAAAAVRSRYEEQTAQLDFEGGRANARSPGKVNGQNADSQRGAPGARLDASVAETYTTPMEHHNPMEPHATLAHWHGDQLIVYDTTQYISGVHTTLAKTLGIPRDRIRVICPFVGGGFGCKGSTWSHVALAAMASRRLGRPVKLVLDRSQMFGPVGGRPLTVQALEIGAQRDGKFVATRHDVVSHTSMIEDFTEPAALQTRIMYDSPYLETRHRLVSLNVGTPTFQRAPGHATGTFALESAIDELGYRLGMDPIELRLRNEPAVDPEKRLPWSSRSLRQCFETGAAAFGWSRRNPRPRAMIQGSTAIGLGVAGATYPANRSAANASARMTTEGRVIVQSGTQDLGTGTYTVMTQIAADTLGFPVGLITFELGDSTMPEAPVSGGSQSLASVGPVVQAACAALRDKLIHLAIADPASPVRGASPADILIENGRIGLHSGGAREPLSALGARAGADVVATAKAEPGAEKKQYSMHSFGAVFVEAHVDAQLGVISVPRVVARYSVGRLINLKTGRSQLMGGVVWGLGMALMEESVLDRRDGRIVNANLADYHVPTNADIGEIDVDVVPEDDVHFNPLGARGIGEIGITGVAAALANAVYHAIGVRVRDLPITLDKLLET